MESEDSVEEMDSIPPMDKKQQAFIEAICNGIDFTGGNPETHDKLLNYKQIKPYPKEQVTDFIKKASQTIQNDVENLIENETVKHFMAMSDHANEYSENSRKQEVILALKILSESTNIPFGFKTNGVSFTQLYRFLYRVMSGLPTNVKLNTPTENMLFDTYKELMDRVEIDATPENLAKLRRKLGEGNKNGVVKGFDELKAVFENPSINLYNLPFEELLKLNSINILESDEFTEIQKLLEKE